MTYWNEIVDEADEQIDLLSEDEHNIPDTNYQGLNVLKPPEARTKDEMLNQKAEAREAKRRQENAKKAKAFADQEYPGEKWQQEKEWGDNIYVSPQKKRGEGTGFANEIRDAEILRDLGSTVYLVPEIRSNRNKKYDAIVNGMMMEFKNVGGNANTLFSHFLESREQAPNVFINLETSNLTRREIMGALYSARNSKLRMSSRGTPIRGYAEYNRFSGGRIILKLKGV